MKKFTVETTSIVTAETPDGRPIMLIMSGRDSDGQTQSTCIDLTIEEARKMHDQLIQILLPEDPF